ncbi:MAG: glycine cleavage system protein H [Planctomycetota bacterium]|jgi:glycine cleavage system H protein
MIREDYVYTKNHQWVKPGEPLVEVGVTGPLLRKVGPLISIELPEADDELKMEVPYGELEGRHMTHQLWAPVEARIVEVNDELIWNHAKLLKDPYGEGWLLRVQPHDPAEVMGLFAGALYRKFCADDLGEEFLDE